MSTHNVYIICTTRVQSKWRKIVAKRSYWPRKYLYPAKEIAFSDVWEPWKCLMSPENVDVLQLKYAFNIQCFRCPESLSLSCHYPFQFRLTWYFQIH